MRLVDIPLFFAKCGVRINELDAPVMLNYFRQMAESKQIMCIFKGTELNCIALFTVTNNPEKVLHKKDWEYIRNDDYGKVIVFDYLVALEFTFELKSEIREILIENFPDFEYAIWKRNEYTYDRTFKANKEIRTCTR